TNPCAYGFLDFVYVSEPQTLANQRSCLETALINASVLSNSGCPYRVAALTGTGGCHPPGRVADLAGICIFYAGLKIF
ncbi:MAG: hypothetical protein AB1330_11910, partial [Bacillota bacterium]